METLISHISTHSERSAEDRSAVTYLESVLSPGGKINTSFGKDDKWPNHDGRNQSCGGIKYNEKLSL